MQQIDRESRPFQGTDTSGFTCPVTRFSHRGQIRKTEADIYYSNTAQLLTSFVEALTENRDLPDWDSKLATPYLQEALELFQRCLSLQEFKYTQALENPSQNIGSPVPSSEAPTAESIDSSTDPDEEEIWASIEEPVTKQTLVDTVIAQLETLTLLSSLGSSNSHDGLAWMEEYHRNTLQSKARAYIESPTQQREVALATAKFVCSLSDAAFRSDHIDLPTYERELNAAFAMEKLPLSNDPQGLCDKADAELAFVTSVCLSAPQTSEVDLAHMGSICWKHTTRALGSLTDAAQVPGALNEARVHIRRGDCEMLRLRLGDQPLNYELAIKSGSTLLKNAEIHYRHAKSLPEKDGEIEKARAEAEAKEAIALFLAGDINKLRTLLKTKLALVQSTQREMVEEGLLGPRSTLLLSDPAQA